MKVVSLQRSTGNQLTPAQHTVAARLANGCTHEEAAECAGVDRTTIYNWKDNPAFLALIRRYRREVIEQTIGMMSRYAVDAACVLHRLMNHSKLDPVRLGAAKAIIENARTLQQLYDMQSEMDAMKQQLAELQNRSPQSRVVA